MKTCSGLNGDAQENIHVLISKTRECDLIWENGLSGCNEVKDLQMRSFWIRMGPDCKDKQPYKRERKRTQRRRTRGKRERMEWHGRKPRTPRKLAHRGQEKHMGQILPQSPERNQPCSHLDFLFPDSTTVREQISVGLSHPFCGNLL